VDLTEEQRIAAEFAAQVLGGVLADGEPPPHTMLAWLLAHPGVTWAEVAAEFAARGVDVSPLARGELLPAETSDILDAWRPGQRES
jgi:hypothetical protein